MQRLLIALLIGFGSAAGPLPAQIVSSYFPIVTSWDAVVDNSRGRVYITTGDGTVERYDVATNSMLTPFTTGGDLRAIDITPDGSAIYMTDRNQPGDQAFVRKVDLASGVSSTLSYNAPGERGSFDLIILSNSKAMLTADQQGSGAPTALRAINLQTGQITQRGTDAVEQSTELFRSPDRSKAFLTGGNSSAGPYRVYDAATDSFPISNDYNEPLNGMSAAFSPNGSLLAFEGYNTDLNLYRTSDFSIVKSFPHYRAGLGFDPQGLLFMADDSDDVFRVYNPSIGQEIATFPAGFDLNSGLPDQTINFSADGRSMYYVDLTGLHVFTGVITPEPAMIAPTLAAGIATLARRRQRRDLRVAK